MAAKAQVAPDTYLRLDRQVLNRIRPEWEGHKMVVYLPYSYVMDDGSERIVVTFRYRPPKPQATQYAYRRYPNGEVVEKVGKSKFKFPDGLVTTDRLSLRWQHDEQFKDSQTTVIRETNRRTDVRAKRTAAGKRRHKANPTFMPKIAKIHLENPEVKARWLEGLKAGLATPEAHANMSAGQKRALAVPGYLARRTEAVKTGHATRKAKIEQAFQAAEQADAAITAAQEKIDRLNQELKQAKIEKAEAKAARVQLPIDDTIRLKLAQPDRHPWMSTDEVAAVFGIHRATFFRNVKSYKRLRRGHKGFYATASVAEQLKAEQLKASGLKT